MKQNIYIFLKKILPVFIVNKLLWLKNLFRSHYLKTNNLYSNYQENEVSFLPSFVNYERRTHLCLIMKSHGSDKGMYQGISMHNYTTFYHAIFKNSKEKPIRLFELGIGTTKLNISANMGQNGRPGASLKGWMDFFIKGKIFGADIDREILFNNERIKTFYCDQTDPSVIKAMWSEKELQDDFDIIIDDGLHQFNANRCFFENSHHKLKVNGTYIIEDVLIGEIAKWENLISEYTWKFPGFRFTIVTLPNRFNHRDNNLIAIRRYY